MVMYCKFLVCFFSQSLVDINVEVKRKLKQHINKLRFRVVSKYKRYFQLRNRFLSVSLRILYMRRSKKWKFNDFFFFKQLRIKEFKFFTYKLALMLKQLIKFLYKCNETEFKHMILNKYTNFSNRLDLVCIRAKFFKTILEARNGIKRGFVHVNSAVITYWNFYLQKNDFVTLHDRVYFKERFRGLRDLFKFGWRIPYVLRIIQQFFGLVNQLRLCMCEFIMVFKYNMFVSFFSLNFIFMCFIRSAAVISRWCLFVDSLVIEIPDNFINCAFFMRPFFKRKLRNCIEKVRKARIRYIRCLPVRRALSRIWFFRAKRIPYYIKLKTGYLFHEIRTDGYMHISRYVRSISNLILFFWMSLQYMYRRYRRKKFDLLGKSISFFFPDSVVYVYMFIHYIYFSINVLFSIIRFGGIMWCLDLCNIISRVICIGLSYTCKKVFYYSNRGITNFKFVKIKRHPKMLIGTLVVLCNNLVHFNFIYFCLLCMKFIKDYFQVLDFMNYDLYLNVRLVRRVCFVMGKRKFRSYTKREYPKYRVYSIRLNFCVFLFNLFIYLDCLDFDIINMNYLNICLLDYLVIFFNNIDLKCNLAVGLFTFFDCNSSFSFFFNIFNIDNFNRFIYIFFEIREGLYVAKGFYVKHVYRIIRLGLGMVEIRILSCVRDFMFLLNIFLNKLECKVNVLELKLKYILFIILFLCEYILHFFGYIAYISYVYFKIINKRSGICIWDCFYNKFLMYNWHINLRQYLNKFKYGLRVVSVNTYSLYANLLYVNNFCYILKKFRNISIFFRDNSYYDLYFFLYLQLFNIRLNAGLYFNNIIYVKNLICVSDIYFFFIMIISLRFNIILDNLLFLRDYFFFFDMLFSGLYDFNINFFKLYFNFKNVLFRLNRRKLVKMLKRRYYIKRVPMVLSHCFSTKTFKLPWNDEPYWTYYIKSKILYRAKFKCNVYERQYLRNYILRYHFSLKISSQDIITRKYIRKLKANFFFSKSFLYCDIEYNTQYPSFVYIGDYNQHIRRLQLRFNFFMTLILRSYMHSKSLNRFN